MTRGLIPSAHSPATYFAQRLHRIGPGAHPTKVARRVDDTLLLDHDPVDTPTCTILKMTVTVIDAETLIYRYCTIRLSTRSMIYDHGLNVHFIIINIPDAITIRDARHPADKVSLKEMLLDSANRGHVYFLIPFSRSRCSSSSWSCWSILAPFEGSFPWSFALSS